MLGHVQEPVSVGDVVWVQMYDPMGSGRKYKNRQLMKIAGIIEDYNATGYAQSMGAHLETRLVTRFWLTDPDRPNDENRMSWVESDWVILESAAADLGMLF